MEPFESPDIAGIFLEKGWLFKSGGMVFGPSPAQTIIDKVYSGELTGESEVAEGEGLWTPLRQVGLFYPHIIQAEAKFRTAKIEAEKRRRERKKAIIKGAKAGLISFAVCGILVSGGLVLNKYRPWEKYTKKASPENVELRGATLDEWVERHPPLVSLGLKRQMKEGEKEKDAIAKAEPQASTSKKGRKERAPRRGAEKGGKEDLPAKDSKEPGTKVASASSPPSQADTELVELSDNEIYQVIQRNISKLFVCLREELKRTPDLRGQVEIEFSIKNDGHVGEVWIDDFRFKEGPLKQCFQEKLASWKFSRFSGERRIVKYPFFIGKR